MSTKPHLWNGKNKAYARRIKFDYVRKLHALEHPIKVISLPGTHAFFERLLVHSQICDINDILCFERDSKYFDELRQNTPELKNLKVVVTSLSDGLISYGKNNTYLGLNKQITVADFDTCGPYCDANYKTLGAFFNYWAANEGLLFINSMKGREVNPEELLHVSPIQDLSTALYKKVILELEQLPEKVRMEAGRILTIPCNYALMAEDYGFNLFFEKLIEYNDQPPNMLQYIFRFKKKTEDKKEINQVSKSYLDIWNDYRSCHKNCNRQNKSVVVHQCNNIFLGRFYQKYLPEKQ